MVEASLFPCMEGALLEVFLPKCLPPQPGSGGQGVQGRSRSA